MEGGQVFRQAVQRMPEAVRAVAAAAGIDPEAIEISYALYSSKDGTEIPMFVVHKKGIALDGANPTLAVEYPEMYVSMGITAENVADEFKVSREEHLYNVDAEDIVPMEVNRAVKLPGGGFEVEERYLFGADECNRPNTTLDGLATLLGERTALVAFPHVSNLLGGILDVADVTRLAHDVGDYPRKRKRIWRNVGLPWDLGADGGGS